MVNNKSIQKGQDDKRRLVLLGLICWPLLVVLSF
jgi:hypothetical protein